MKEVIISSYLAFFNVPAGDAFDTLRSFQSQLPSDVYLLVVWGKLELPGHAGFNANGIIGWYDYRDALTLILRDTPLYWLPVNRNTMRVLYGDDPLRINGTGPDHIKPPTADWKK